MTETTIPDVWFHRIKSATRDLIKHCGGVERSGSIANFSKSEVSRWQSSTDATMIPLAAILTLEADCGVPLVLSVMAELGGNRLAGRDREGREAASVMASHAEVMRRFSDMMAQGAAAVADGTVTPAEAETWDRAVSGIMSAIEPLRQSLAAIKSGGDLRVVK